MPENTSAVSVRELRQVFRVGGRTVEALRDVSFEVARGESLAIVGESGSGKTTLARILMGLERPAGGTVQVDGATLKTRRMRG